jgi:hypothetical protein
LLLCPFAPPDDGPFPASATGIVVVVSDASGEGDETALGDVVIGAVETVAADPR